MHINTLLIASALLLGVTVVAIWPADHLHMQCKVIWLIAAPCEDVYIAVVNQIKAWRGRESCEHGGKNCLYELVSVTPYEIKAKKMYPSTRNVNDLTFNLYRTEESSTCRMSGDAISESWISLMDNCANYCSLKDLLVGSGLSKIQGFQEYTNDWICHAYESANCTVKRFSRRIGE
ncbi:uncharacterized protein wu:fc46h12 [Coregonus clupeaformis]|uniref:uncharacterized protein wu:fc46h12 n=1 Tax=Coregonus clupeaformis TaxID=59861 RepID=UPI001BDF87E3|nr:uncharacterized protein wu:fc46h12 [Coregonus clupeaformis]